MTIERSGKEEVTFLRQLVKGFAELYPLHKDLVIFNNDSYQPQRLALTARILF